MSSHSDLKKFFEVEIVEDNVTDNMEIIRNIINKEKPKNPFFVTDMGDIIERHQQWMSKIPKFTPNHVVKYGYTESVIKILATLNSNAYFCCKYKHVISNVIKYVRSEQIIFSNLLKSPSDISYCQKMGIAQIMVDDVRELLMIEELFPKANIVIRVSCDAKNFKLKGEKSGCTLHEAARLIQGVFDSDLKLHGFSFHDNTPCLEIKDYLRRLDICKWLIEFAKNFDFEGIEIINLGRFSNICEEEFDEVAKLINGAIENFDLNIRVISELDIDSSFTLVSYLHTKKIDNFDCISRMFYTCSEVQPRVPELVFKPRSNKTFISYMWEALEGHKLPDYELILQNVLLPELHIGDWLAWKNASNFIIKSFTYKFSVIRKSQWKSFVETKKHHQNINYMKKGNQQ